MGSEPPTNMVSLLVYCTTDNSLMLTVENPNSDHWIPSVKVEPSVSWSRTVTKEAQEVVPYKTAPLTNLLKTMSYRLRGLLKVP